MGVQARAPSDQPDTATVDDRIIAVMRFALALSALLITIIDPSEPDRLVAVTYTALSLYTLYSLALYIIVQRSEALHASISERAARLAAGACRSA